MCHARNASGAIRLSERIPTHGRNESDDLANGPFATRWSRSEHSVRCSRDTRQLRSLCAMWRCAAWACSSNSRNVACRPRGPCSFSCPGSCVTLTPPGTSPSPGVAQLTAKSWVHGSFVTEGPSRRSTLNAVSMSCSACVSITRKTGKRCLHYKQDLSGGGLIEGLSRER